MPRSSIAIAVSSVGTAAGLKSLSMNVRAQTLSNAGTALPTASSLPRDCGRWYAGVLAEQPAWPATERNHGSQLLSGVRPGLHRVQMHARPFSNRTSDARRDPEADHRAAAVPVVGATAPTRCG